MKAIFSTAGLARASAIHPWRTVGAWAAVLATSILLVFFLLGDALSTETSFSNNPESQRASNLLDSRLGDSGDTIHETVIVRSDTLTVDDPAFRQSVETLYGALLALGSETVDSGATYYLTGDESLVSADRRTTLIPLVIPEAARSEIGSVHQIVDTVNGGGAFQVLITGEATLEEETTKIAERDLAIGEGIGISAALVVLALVIGSVAAAFLPILLAVIAIVIALGATAVLGQAVDLPFFITNMITMMGLAVGIDYSLFIVARYREERAKGLGKIDAIAVSGRTAGRTVLVSGITVGVALVGLLITPDSSTKAIGAGALLVVFAAVVASMTLLPAMLSILGNKVDSLRIPLPHRKRSATTETPGGFWNRTTGLVMRRPVVSLLLAVGLLLAAASNYLVLNQGEVGISSLPDNVQSKAAFTVLQQEFGYGQDLPAVIVIDGQAGLPSVQAAVERLQSTLASDPAFVSSSSEVHLDANLTIVRGLLAGDPSSPEAMAAVERLRANYIPRAFAGVPVRAMVTGETARFVDQLDANETYTPIVIIFVLGVSFLLLTVALRSIVIPIKAILMNLLSVAASYGLLVLVFQKGVGADLLGFQQVDAIQTGLPLFLFAVLFGLSMDYHVFLLSRIRERFLESGDNSEAVAHGLRSTGRLITGAALIMVAVFGGFAAGDLVAMQQFGFGLAVAVLLDATIVRTILVPASMRLLGKWNWYLPNVLSWLPKLTIEAPAPADGRAWGD